MVSAARGDELPDLFHPPRHSIALGGIIDESKAKIRRIFYCRLTFII